MADGIETALQKAIFATLTGADFRAAAGEIPVHDRVPPGVKPPYIKIGDDQVTGDIGSEVHVTVVVWTPAPGKPQAKLIGDQVRAFLAPQQDPRDPSAVSPFTLDGHQLVTWSFGGAQYLDDTDGVSAKGVLSFTYETYPTA